MYWDNALKKISWSDFNGLLPSEKVPYLMRDGWPYHALIAQQFDRATLDTLCNLATKIRTIAKTKEGALFLQSLLADKRVMLYFAQPSTRTFLSFASACQILGIKTAEVRDTATSSEIKGESAEDSVRTFSSYFDMIIMRHPTGGFAERIAWVLSNSARPIPLVNAGSGKDQHPTQALLDIYTLQRSFERIGGIEGKKIGFVGDLARGRTVRSLSLLLSQYAGVKLYFIAPEALQIKKDILATLDEKGVSYELASSLEPLIPELDAIYMTRIQDEWDDDTVNSVDNTSFCFSAKHLPLLKQTAILMHPLPRRNEIDVDVDTDPRAIYWRQVRNGMWMRAALILSIFGRAHELNQWK